MLIFSVMEEEEDELKKDEDEVGTFSFVTILPNNNVLLYHSPPK